MKIQNMSKENSLVIQWNFSGSNTDVSFTTAISNSFLSPLNPIAADIIVFGIILILGDFLFHIENVMMCVLIKIASIMPSVLAV